MPGIEQYLGWQNVRDYGAVGDGNFPNDGSAINEALLQAVKINGTGARIIIPPSTGAYLIDTPILPTDYCTIYICAGAALQAPKSATYDLIDITNATAVRIINEGLILGSGNASQAAQRGMVLYKSQECEISGGRIALCGASGIEIQGGELNRVHRMHIHDCGRHGILLTLSTQLNDIAGMSIYGNGRALANTYDGVHLANAALYNSIRGCFIFDGVTGQLLPATQAYSVREEATCDYTFVYALQALGNLTSNTPSFAGVHSKTV